MGLCHPSPVVSRKNPYSIEQNLKPTVQWLLDLGLRKSQIAKAVATFPQVLSYSIKQNLQPSVQWFLDLGLAKSQVAKAVATHPQILALSIKDNLKPTVQWFLDLGLTKSQVAKAVASFPQILGLSLESNLKQKIALMLSFLTQEAVVWQLASFLPILGYRYERLQERLAILALQNKTSQLSHAMILTKEKFAQKYQ